MNKTINKNPEFFITSGRNRIKQFEDKVYLRNGQTFEIELYNPTNETVLAQIKMNGKAISSSGIVLKPANRVFLERYLDTNNKFVFETYEVNGSPDDLNAISLNGFIEVKFYKESEPFIPQLTPTIQWNDMRWNDDNTGTYRYYNQDFTTISGISNITFTTTGLDNTQLELFSNGNLGLGNTTPNAKLNISNNTRSLSKKSKGVETGRVEKGDRSNQHFETYSGTFQSYAFHTTSWTILPESRKPITPKDVNKVYCTGCGTRRKKQSWMFCPNCGSKH